MIVETKTKQKSSKLKKSPRKSKKAKMENRREKIHCKNLFSLVVQYPNNRSSRQNEQRNGKEIIKEISQEQVQH